MDNKQTKHKKGIALLLRFDIVTLTGKAHIAWMLPQISVVYMAELVVRLILLLRFHVRIIHHLVKYSYSHCYFIVIHPHYNNINESNPKSISFQVFLIVPCSKIGENVFQTMPRDTYKLRIQDFGAFRRNLTMMEHTF